MTQPGHGQCILLYFTFAVKPNYRKRRFYGIYIVTAGFVRGACRIRDFTAWGKMIYRCRKRVGLG